MFTSDTVGFSGKKGEKMDWGTSLLYVSGPHIGAPLRA